MLTYSRQSRKWSCAGGVSGDVPHLAPPDRVDQVLRRKWLRKIGHATDAQRRSACGVVISRRNEDDRERNSSVRQFALQVDARKPIEVDIEHQASCFAQIRTLDKAVDRKEGLDVEPSHLEEPLDGSQHAEVIVKDEDKLAWDRHVPRLALVAASS